MEEIFVKRLHQHIQDRNKSMVQSTVFGERMSMIDEQKLNMHRKRNAKIVRSFVEGDIIRSLKIDDRLFVYYQQRTEHLIKIKDTVYIEEKVEYRRACFKKDKLVEDHLITQPQDKQEQPLKTPDNYVRREARFVYNRREAVRYAERWWNDHNSAYRQFTDNCTNFISQCLHAGGAPMTGYPNRSKGWWYQSNNWSYSWSVAHSLRWYLSGATTGLRAEEKQSAKGLKKGDIICYDFDGDGRWQHTTIVVAYDANNEPLVNAQTSNSRMRYWTYEDSTAWTPNIKYKFFHIVDQ